MCFKYDFFNRFIFTKLIFQIECRDNSCTLYNTLPNFGVIINK